MKLDKFKILSEADAKFGSSRSGKVSIKLSEKCVDIAQEWLDETYYGGAEFLGKDSKTLKKELKKELKEYIRPRIVKYKKSTFIPTVVWWWLAQVVINWVIDRIIDYILKNH